MHYVLLITEKSNGSYQHHFHYEKTIYRNTNYYIILKLFVYLYITYYFISLICKYMCKIYQYKTLYDFSFYICFSIHIFFLKFPFECCDLILFVIYTLYAIVCNCFHSSFELSIISFWYKIRIFSSEHHVVVHTFTQFEAYRIIINTNKYHIYHL